MNVNDLFPRKWLAPEDLQGRSVTVTIDSVSLVKVHNPRTQREEHKLCVAFVARRKRMLLNKTQAFALAAAVGSDDTDTWPGCRILLSTGVAPNRQSTLVVGPAPDATPPPLPAPSQNGSAPAAESGRYAPANAGDEADAADAVADDADEGPPAQADPGDLVL